MKTLQIFKHLRAFSIRTVYACMIGASIFLLNGCNNLNDEQIIPKEASIEDLVKEYNLKKVGKPTGDQKVIFLKDMAKANQFFQNLKMRTEDLPNLGKQSSTRASNETILSNGFFTFLNGQTATIHFNTQPEGVGEVVSANIDGQELEFTQRGSSVEMVKWGYIAVHYGQDDFSDNYFYYYAPIAIYGAILINGGWSSVQLLNTAEQANFEGEGVWEEVYIANPNQLRNDLPVTDPWIPYFPKD